MPSIIPGLEYDIFISYRHKDNKYDEWVTGFVDNLSKELESTFKEEITIYFDKNPHDGLRENEDVDASLQPKLRCGVFLPIVSQTYCDCNSFAWKNELLPFVKSSSEDEYGLKVRGPRGNVASRVLPIRIHNLDEADIKLFEEATGGPFRPIDFVYRTVGVNRPLRAIEEDPRGNLDHTYYRNQINKVAAAVKEVLSSLAAPDVHTERTPKPVATHQRRIPTVPILISVIIAGVLTAIVFIFTKGNTSASVVGIQEVDSVSITPSIAVLPFADMSAEHDQEYFGDGLSEELLNLLAKVPELRVISRTSAFSFKDKNEDITSIAKKLNVAYILEGSVRKDGETIRITAQLINGKDGAHLWSETYDRNIQSLFKIQDQIAVAVVEQLKLKLFNLTNQRAQESKPHVYNYWLQGKYILSERSTEGADRAEELFLAGYALDSTDARIRAGLAMVEYNRTSFGTSSLEEHKIHLNKAINHAREAVRLDPNLAEAYRVLGICLQLKSKNNDAEVALNRAYELEPNNSWVMNSLGNLYSIMGRFEDAERAYHKAITLEPLRNQPYINYAWTLLALGKTNEARKYISKVTATSTMQRLSLASVYIQLHQFDSALTVTQSIDDDFWRSYLNTIIRISTNQTEEGDVELQKLIKNYSKDGAFQIAEIYALMKNREEAMRWLQIAERQKDPGILEMNSSIYLSIYKDDPRYQAVLNRRDMSASIDERMEF